MGPAQARHKKNRRTMPYHDSHGHLTQCCQHLGARSCLQNFKKKLIFGYRHQFPGRRQQKRGRVIAIMTFNLSILVLFLFLLILGNTLTYSHTHTHIHTHSLYTMAQILVSPLPTSLVASLVPDLETMLKTGLGRLQHNCTSDPRMREGLVVSSSLYVFSFIQAQ